MLLACVRKMGCPDAVLCRSCMLCLGKKKGCENGLSVCNYVFSGGARFLLAKQELTADSMLMEEPQP